MPVPELEELDRWALHQLQKVITRVRRAFERYDFHVVYHTLYQFCTNELSAFYLDVLKDRLYTSAPQAPARRSAQTALWRLLQGLVRLMAPVLSFTAEEIWSHLPEREREGESVHLAQFPEVDPALLDDALEQRWENLLLLRGEVTRALERARRAQVIGHPLDAEVRLLFPESWKTLIPAYRAMLPTLLIVSQVTVINQPETGEGYTGETIPGLTVWVAKAQGKKCERCWNFSPEVGNVPDHPTLCQRCFQALEEIGFSHDR
ncbi:MAG: hypothetical protein EHM75_06780 [Desulfobacteraceae bacterium]|nr:MAG: hypothetical protein EHM75_06780 [Desulfobacteraceae bacterium]